MNMLLNGPAASKRWTICQQRIFSVAMTSSVAECGGVELMMEREGVVDGEEERTAIMSGHHSFLEEIQRRLEQVMQMEALVNEEEDCSWSER